MALLWFLLLLVAALALFRFFHGGDLSIYDKGYPAPLAGRPPSAEHKDAVLELEAILSASDGNRVSREKIQRLREAMDNIGADRDYGCEFRPGGPDAPAGEWVLAPGADTTRRLLYVHGGGFVAGSPRSHRIITDALAQLTGMVVYSLDYRLVPEHSRLACLDDAEQAIGWLRQHGPDGPAPAVRLAIAGDSAGGSITLATLQRLRDKGETNVDAAVAICPSTDSTLRSPSMRFNREQDKLLGRSVGAFAAMPAPLRHGISAIIARRSPAGPELSPVRGDLSGLPPTLLQASLTEMLIDDAARYYQRAREAGSPVQFQTFDNMIHVWHIFYPRLPEAALALEAISQFLSEHGCCGAADREDAA